jgi:phage-related minor tail protein
MAGKRKCDEEADDAEARELAEQAERRMRELERSANSFARVMTNAFAQSVIGARNFEDVLKSLALRMSDLAVRMAFKPLEGILASGFQKLFSGFFEVPTTTTKAAMGAIKPFAAGGVIGTPTYFPLASGGLGLAGEAGPEAIMPLARGPDGRLGVAARASAPSSITVNIATPDAESFRRSEVYITGQIARAVARGQRGL